MFYSYKGDGSQINKQVFFIEDDESEDMDIATKLDTEPDLVDRVYNRPRKGQLEVFWWLFWTPLTTLLQSMSSITENTARADHERRKTQRELSQRMERLTRLQNALKVLDKAAEVKVDEKNAVEVTNKNLAKKYNFVQLRKK